MSVATGPMALARAARFYDSTVGKKAVMAVTGAILFGFVVVHMLGNLQFYLGPEALNAYGAGLRKIIELLWIARIVLLAAVILHITSALQLTQINKAARPQGYRKLSSVNSSFASRNMLISGLALLAFIVYHLLHLTFGSVHPDFQEAGGVPDVYHNVVAGFSQVPAAVAYIVAMFFLGLHLVHGVWSMFQSLGLSHPKHTPVIRKLATAAAALLVLGNISIPIAVLLGFHQ